MLMVDDSFRSEGRTGEHLEESVFWLERGWDRGAEGSGETEVEPTVGAGVEALAQAQLRKTRATQRLPFAWSRSVRAQCSSMQCTQPIIEKKRCRYLRMVSSQCSPRIAPARGFARRCRGGLVPVYRNAAPRRWPRADRRRSRSPRAGPLRSALPRPPQTGPTAGEQARARPLSMRTTRWR
jgi:hypothetical protein